MFGLFKGDPYKEIARQIEKSVADARLDELKERLRNVEKRLKQAECVHKDVVFGRSSSFSPWVKRCTVCKKVLDNYATLAECLEAEAAYHSEKAREIKASLPKKG